ncbi:deoxyguanosinetriphosphate triphosphohydrolase-like protein [Kroppenstedtia guangzhouensis]|jgi:dGTPase|uniref:Deoxyguanosinetriphosphate triphosphohydrolase-like protein n=1 Tax=Kroppenstedtia guangzhouensis TaxID=1274356 RepID=A0ABQ1GAZ5_9BACL|nr:anti-phage deoxyguanosine triphosphatase [Kroppenstedtia guangzhouensis]GGA40167.1 deoxyguanosinetriphosphate triphosphohydrolase-like protein [Kroppenstedtia guangzhouensis]
MWFTVGENRFYRREDRERRIPHGPRSERDLRDPFERDHGRIVHSAAFRRLQSKKQVIGTDRGDFHRTRLTHSMEVAQIARGIALSLNRRSPLLSEGGKIDISLVEAAALAHDLGHPPFGHEGERALHRCMSGEGGFEGNAQTFRILTRLEGKKGEGLNLTRALLLSVMKYPILLGKALQDPDHPQAANFPPKASVYTDDREVFHWVLDPFTVEEIRFFTETEPEVSPFLRTSRKSLECSLIDLADDIAYATHDLEDAINFRLVEVEELLGILEEAAASPTIEELRQALALTRKLHPRQRDFKYKLKQVVANLISAFVNCTDLVKQGDSTYSPRFRYRVVLPEGLKQLNRALKKTVRNRVIDSPDVQALAFKGERIVRLLFEAMMAEEKLLPENDRRSLEQAPEQRARIVCDYIAGMTDPFAERMYHRLYGSGRDL